RLSWSNTAAFPKIEGVKLIQPNSRRESESANVDVAPQRRFRFSPTIVAESGLPLGSVKRRMPVTTPVRVSSARKRPPSVRYVGASSLPSARSLRNAYEPSARVGSDAVSDGSESVRRGDGAVAPTLGNGVPVTSGSVRLRFA